MLLLVLLEHSPNDSSLWWSEWPCLKCSSISSFVSFSASVISPSNAAFVKLYEFWTKDVCFVALVLLLFVELSAFCRDFKRDLRVSIVVVVLPFLICLYCFLSDRSSLLIWETSLCLLFGFAGTLLFDFDFSAPKIISGRALIFLSTPAWGAEFRMFS